MDELKKIPLTAPKPKLRGISHLLAALVAIPAAWHLSGQGTMPSAKTAIYLYAGCLIALFAVSAIYHVPFWNPEPRARLRRLDRSMIYLFIAGTYTPLLVVLERVISGIVLPLVWSAAAVGIVLTILDLKWPRLVRSMPYVVLGWGAVMLMPTVLEHLGRRCFWLILSGGIPYTVGTLAYALKRPNPWPSVFGYHEIFHIMVIVAAVLHYLGILDAISRPMPL